MTDSEIIDQAVQSNHKGRAFGGKKTSTSQGGKVRISGGETSSGRGGGGYGSKAYGVSKGSRGPRVVHKANYVKGGRGSGEKMRESARYYMTRENEQGEKEKRRAFSKDQEGMDFAEVKARLDKHEKAYHYRIVIAPETDKDAEGGNLKELTRKVMQTVERGQGQEVSWVGVEHSAKDAHTEHAHVHVIASLEQKLDKNDFREMRFDAELAWRLEMAQQREAQRGLDHAAEYSGLQNLKAHERSRYQDQGLEL